MHRRQYLALSGATLSTTVTGCSILDAALGDGTPTETPSPTERRLEAFRSSLESAGHVLGETALHDGILTVEYESSAETETAILEEVEPIALAFLEVLEDGMDAEWLEAWLLDADAEERAVYTIHETWVREWDSGERTEQEFFGRIEQSINWQ